MCVCVWIQGGLGLTIRRQCLLSYGYRAGNILNILNDALARKTPISPHQDHICNMSTIRIVS